MYTTPPRWTANTAYPAGAVVWHSGCYWRCEREHTSSGQGAGGASASDAQSGAPNDQSDIWLPVSTTQPPTDLLDRTVPPPSYAPYASPVPGLTSAPHVPNSTSTPPGYTGPSTSTSTSTSRGRSPPASASATINAVTSLFSSMFDRERGDKAPASMSSSTPSPAASWDSATSTERSTPSSDGTVTQEHTRDEKRGWNQTAEMISDKAAESLRYVTLQKERHESHDAEALRHELKGKKVWRVGGVGMWAYEDADESEEQKKQVWRKWGEMGEGKDAWLRAARARTDTYNRESHGVKPLLRWKLVERGGNLPDDALPIGHEANGAFLYACRAWWEGGLHLGKAGAHLINKASISYGGSEITLDIYEVLCGPSDPTVLQWRSYTHGDKATVDGWQPVEGGREKDGMPIFIAKGDYENGVHPGKCLINDDHACIGWGGGELWVRPFQVLAYCSPYRR